MRQDFDGVPVPGVLVGKPNCSCFYCSQTKELLKRDEHCKEHRDEERRERQRVWSKWLDEHIGPGCEIQLDGDDREELAVMLSRATYITPQKTTNGWRECK